jgi:hypothetical protein
MDVLTHDRMMMMEPIEFDIGDFKVALNTFMIQYAPENLTIKEAELLMVDFCDEISRAHLRNEAA